MLTTRSILITFPLIFCALGISSAQKMPQLPKVPVIGRETVEIKRTRPADVFLPNGTSIAVSVVPIDSRSAHLVERLKKIIANGVIGANRASLREVSRSQSPQVVIECSITRCEYTEKTEEKKLLGVKDKGKFKIITFMLEASYRVVKTKDNFVYFADNTAIPYKDEFQEGVQSAPNKSEIEDGLMNRLIKSITAKLTNTEEPLKVRLMGKGDLSRYARLAQGGQWDEYINSINALPKAKPDKSGQNGFEGDKHYNLSIAYEALAYKDMWNDPASAEKYFDMAETEIREAQKLDPRESEYVNALTRLLQSKKYLDTIKERSLAKQPVAAGQKKPPVGSPAPGPKVKSNAVTNEDIISMIRGGVSEEIILDTINDAKERRFDGSPAAIIRLNQAGASAALIKLIRTLSAQQPTPTATPTPTRRKGN